MEQMEAAVESESTWRTCGRGWELVSRDSPIEPELVREPRIPKTPPLDDGRVPGFWGRLFTRAADEKADRQDPKLLVSRDPSRHKSPPPAGRMTQTIRFPADLKVGPAQTEQLLLSMASMPTPVSIEIVGGPEAINFQVASSEADAAVIASHLRTQIPGIRVRVSNDLLIDHFAADQDRNTLVADFALAKDWFLPLERPGGPAVDPLIPLLAVMDCLSAGEALCVQVRFARAKQDWQGAANERLFDSSRKLAGVHLRDSIGGIREKLTSPLVAATVKLAAAGNNAARTFELALMAQDFFLQFASPNGNKFVPLSNGPLSNEQQVELLLARESCRSGFLLSPKELEGIVHLPANPASLTKLSRLEETTRELPAVALTGDLVLGANEHDGHVHDVRLSVEKRVKHMHLVGASGSGKSTLLTNMMLQDLEQGGGFALLDPHGDLVDSIAERVPAHRLSDVVVFDPSDEKFPIGFNILSAHSELETTLLASDLVGIFRRFATSWGDQMNSVLSNAVLAFLYSDRGGSLVDLKTFLIDKAYRNGFLETVPDEEIKFYWQREFQELKGKPYAPLLTRLDSFLRTKMIRHIVAQRENKLDFRSIMDQRKILLVKLSLGAIGEENAYLLGSLLVAKIYLAALSRQDISEESRSPFYLYLDEAHHFVTPSLNQILSGVRKYKLGLVLAHQNLSQFHNADADILAGALTNCYARICFRVDDQDAERLARGFSYFTAEHLKNLGVGEAIARFEQSRFSFNLRTLPVDTVPPEVAIANKQACVEQSRRLYAKPKSDVEAEYRRGVAGRGEERSKKGAGAELSESDTAPATAEAPVKRGENLPKETGPLSEHRYLQTVIKQLGEAQGFVSTIEKELFGGLGRIDVALERDGVRVACEVAKTNATEYEVHNIQKSLAAGFDAVAVVSGDRRHLENIRRRAEAALSQDRLLRVHFVEADNFHVFLEKYRPVDRAEGEEARTVKGYRVESTYEETSPADTSRRREAIRMVLKRVSRRAKRKDE